MLSMTLIYFLVDAASNPAVIEWAKTLASPAVVAGAAWRASAWKQVLENKIDNLQSDFDKHESRSRSNDHKQWDKINELSDDVHKFKGKLDMNGGD